jgi:diguanylate cyclase (GGDEF)-like protein
MVIPVDALPIATPHERITSELRSLAVPGLVIAPIQTRQGEFYGLTVVTLPDGDAGSGRRVADGLVAVTDQGATALQNAELLEQIRHQALHDGLTQLANRALFDEDLDKALAQARRDERELSVLFVDLDDFKAVNDRFGHGAGDHVLRTIAERLRQCGRKGDTVARLGGDEFAMLLTGANREDGERVSIRVAELVAAPIALGDVDVTIRASVGIATHPADGHTVDAILRDADRAMYASKRAARVPMRVSSADPTAPREARAG